MTDTPTADKAQAAASTAADEGKHVAGVAQGEAAKVASEAKTQVSSLAGEARTQVTDQVSDQTRQQRDKLVGTLGTLGDDLNTMADNGQGGLAADVAREAAAHARSLTSYLDGREPADLLDDVRDFARRRPGTFLLGALVAGVVAGRVARGVKDADPAPAPDIAAADGLYATDTAALPTTSPTYAAPPASAMPYPDPAPYTPATTAAPFAPPSTPPPSAPPAYSEGTFPSGGQP